jgi:NADPH-dependent 2,4-dienoyl-CoA reductase/sulfur reductase-like enzyme
VVAGGGLLGLEAAGGLHSLGADAAIVHSGGWLMSAQLDEGGDARRSGAPAPIPLVRERSDGTRPEHRARYGA